ncbi:MAG: S46 family peptidase [Gemmatimonadetes bacterium]|nr:S46 family peptidase [Gemmatimonadota bacterium]
MDPRLPLVLLTLALVGCGGARPAEPVSPHPAAQPAVTAAASTPATPAAATPIAAPNGVNLDTVKAGRFDFGKMWTFEFPPMDYFREAYGFTPDQAWFDHARLSALRLPNCSASFVSPNGLVMSNHHCAREALAQVSKPGEDLSINGLYVKSRAEERSVEDTHVDQLIDIVDVTDEVESKLGDVSDEDRAEKQEEVFNDVVERLTKDRGGDGAGINVEVISLFAGGHYSAYVFKRYTNLKLVSAPELQIGFFGGDPDNFTYPRYNLDFSFWRVYDDRGQPVKSDNYFKLDDEGLKPGDPVFVVGNPGSTSRLQTVAELEFRRDFSDKGVLKFLENRMAVFQKYMDEHPVESAELDLLDMYFGASNSQKAYKGQLEGLADPVILTKRLRAQQEFQDSLSKPARAREFGGLISRLAELQTEKRPQGAAYGAFLALTNPDYESSTLARAMLAFQAMNAARGGNPDAGAGVRARFRAVKDKPAQLEQALMAARFQEFVDNFGRDTPWVQSILKGKSPAEAARDVYARTVLADSATAIAAMESGSLGPSDAAVAVVTAYLPAFGAFQQMLGKLSPEEERISAKLGRARMDIYGTSMTPPDATFSLRVADGVVQGYPYNGTLAPAFTNFHGLYDRHYAFEKEYAADPSKSPWALPAKWTPPPAGLDLSTEVNFAFTADIIGGNSGSPVLDKELEVVGLVFDGNIESLPGDYIYLPEMNRAVAVDIRGIVESLDKVYKMDGLVNELRTGQIMR